MHQFAPRLMSFAALVNPEAANVDVQLQYLSDEANRLGIHVQIVNASGETDLAAALDAIAQTPGECLSRRQ